jgi:4-amino-4-deoxy-L-arabinose transferase-like glycosyltransferase
MIKKLLERLFHVKQVPWAERHFVLLLILGALGAMFVSLGIGLSQSVWFDEAYSIMLAKQPIGQLLHLTAVDTHPPLYYILLKTWANTFGWGEFALRSLSALALGGSLLFGGLLVKRLFGVRAALVTLPFILLAPFLLRYGFEIRMYAFASLIGVAATYTLVTAVEAKMNAQRWIRYGIYTVLVALGVYTLYYTALLWIAHLLWLVYVTYKQKKPLLKAPWLLAYAGSVVLFLPWIPTFFQQMNNGALAPISQAMTLENLLGIVSFNFVYQPVWQLGALLSLLVLFVLGVLVFITGRALKVASQEEKTKLMLLAFYMLVPVAILTLVSLFRPMYVERYLAHIALGGMLFVGVVVALATKKSTTMLQSVAGLLIVVLIVGVAHLVQVGNYNFQRLQKPDIAEAAKSLSGCENGSTILAADPYVAIELSYYVKNCDIYFYSEDEQLSGGYAPLSESPLRISDPVLQLATEKSVYYVHYDEPKLQLPENLQKGSEETYGALTVAQFSAE